MYVERVEYPDYNGVERKEDFYFNLTKAELLEMEMGIVGGFNAMIQKAIDAQDTPTLIGIFKDLLLKSYGVKSADGRRFIKNAEVLNEFKETEAYSILFMKYATDAEAASKFIKGIVPADLSQEATEIAPAAKKKIK
jgi:hypothetical protein